MMNALETDVLCWMRLANKATQLHSFPFYNSAKLLSKLDLPTPHWAKLLSTYQIWYPQWQNGATVSPAQQMLSVAWMNLPHHKNDAQMALNGKVFHGYLE